MLYRATLVELSAFRIVARFTDPSMSPHTIKVDLSKKSNIYETEIRIYDNGLYNFNFEFIVKRYKEDKGIDRNKAIEFTGEPYGNGNVMPVK
jgi:hypothetical protein